MAGCDGPHSPKHGGHIHEIHATFTRIHVDLPAFTEIHAHSRAFMRIHATFSTFTLHSRAFTRIHAAFTLHSPCIHGGVAMKGSPRPFQHARVAAASARVSSVVVGQGEASRCAASRRPATRAASAEPPGRAREGPCTRAAPAARRAARHWHVLLDGESS